MFENIPLTEVQRWTLKYIVDGDLPEEEFVPGMRKRIYQLLTEKRYGVAVQLRKDEDIL